MPTSATIKLLLFKNKEANSMSISTLASIYLSNLSVSTSRSLKQQIIKQKKQMIIYHVRYDTETLQEYRTLHNFNRKEKH